MVIVTAQVAFVMAEGHLCVKNAAIRDAEVAFGHDKSFKNDTFHFYEKALIRVPHHSFFLDYFSMFAPSIDRYRPARFC